MASGLVSWDHLDLDEVLGEYTDDNDDRIGADLENCSSSGDDFQDEPDSEGRKKVENPVMTKTGSKRKPSVTRSKYTYVCPDCDKEYQSVSGFRGHMVKKHSRSDLKAHMHKKNSNGESDDVEPVIAQSSRVPSCLPKELFAHAVHDAVDNVYNEPRHRLSCSVNGSGVLKCAEIIQCAGECDMENLLFPRFGSIITSDLVNQPEREALFSKFHLLRMDTGLRDEVVKVIRNLDASVPLRHCIMFYQCFLRELVTCLLQAYNRLISREDESPATTDLTENEKGVLYYVAGFLLHKVSTRKHVNIILIQSCISERKENKFAQWTVKLDRGGLKFPSDNFYELIYQCARCIAARVLTKLHPKCLAKDSTMEALMDHPQIKYTWENLYQCW